FLRHFMAGGVSASNSLETKIRSRVKTEESVLAESTVVCLGWAKAGAVIAKHRINADARRTEGVLQMGFFMVIISANSGLVEIGSPCRHEAPLSQNTMLPSTVPTLWEEIGDHGPAPRLGVSQAPWPTGQPAVW